MYTVEKKKRSLIKTSSVVDYCLDQRINKTFADASVQHQHSLARWYFTLSSEEGSGLDELNLKSHRKCHKVNLQKTVFISSFLYVGMLLVHDYETSADKALRLFFPTDFFFSLITAKQNFHNVCKM